MPGAMAMDDARCADSTRLQQAALDAIIRYYHAESRSGNATWTKPLARQPTP